MRKAPKLQGGDERLEAASKAAVLATRAVVANDELMAKALKDLDENVWNWMATSAVFAWVQARIAQAIDYGCDEETFVRQTGLCPDPANAAVIKAILPELGETAELDWTKPLMEWPEEVMIAFLARAWFLLEAKKVLRDYGPGRIANKKPAFDENYGDPIPFP
jgi:hypothetical protein